MLAARLRPRAAWTWAAWRPVAAAASPPSPPSCCAPRPQRRGLAAAAAPPAPPQQGAGASAAVASLDNTYIMGIRPEQLEGRPEMVRRVFTLLNGRRRDLTKAQKRAALEQHRRFVDDTGSPEVQAAVLSRGIHAMSAHLSANRKDNNCKRILTRLIHRRRKVLQHLYRLSPKRYHKVSPPPPPPPFLCPRPRRRTQLASACP